MRITMGSRLASETKPFPFVDSTVNEETIHGFAKLLIDGFDVPFCPFARISNLFLISYVVR